MNKQELTAMVAEILGSMTPEPKVKASGYRPETPGPERKGPEWEAGDFVPDITQLDLRQLYLTEDPEKPEAYKKLKARTPARLGSGKAGARYRTLTALRFRADHAAAGDFAGLQVAGKGFHCLEEFRSTIFNAVGKVGDFAVFIRVFDRPGFQQSHLFHGSGKHSLHIVHGLFINVHP